MEKKKKKFSGTLILVVGNSSSGKDSIISGVIKRYPLNKKKIYSPKRYITRPPSESEKNYSISPEEFEEMEKNGKFSLSWKIYGLCYGIPIEIDEYLENGHHVIINVSRMIIDEAKSIYENIKVIFIEVPLEIIISRLKERGRESEALIQKRIERAKTYQTFKKVDLIVDNSGELDDAINQLLSYIINIV
ncbi:MAG: phosphonate metabolism protein/1,5-bisphosphokinase (PRPP-forming) PhnN [Promethearchaeota archaeon]